MKKLVKGFGILGIVLALVAIGVYLFVLQYPNLPTNPTVGTWYRVTSTAMKASDGSAYRAFFKKGSENKVLIYFAGGGVSVSQETAKAAMYTTRLVRIDMLDNLVMNMGGLISASDGNPFKDWTVIAFPYATGDFHTGTGAFPYTDAHGNEQILYHYGYTNYTAVMTMVMERAGIENPEAVVVTGYSAGGFGSALLADDIFTTYFPHAASKTVLVDSALLLNDDWHQIATEVWQTPNSIADRLTTNDITLDSLTALHAKYGTGVHILFTSSTRDGDLAKVQNYFDTGTLDVDEALADQYQQRLKATIPQLTERAGASVFLWDGLPWYDDPRNLTMHTIIATPHVFATRDQQTSSIADWLMHAVQHTEENHGLDLVNKDYQ